MSRVLSTAALLTALLIAGTAQARGPVIVELYTAQGCASCDSSNALITTLASRRGVIALTFDVDYWDYLGWKDTFAQPEFTQRQRDFDKQFGLRDVYTPQIIVQGEAQASGDKTAAVETLIRRAARRNAGGPELTPRADGTVEVGAVERRRDRPRRPDDVWLVRYDARQQSIAVESGDNHGKSVSVRNVVRQLARLGEWTGRRRVFHLPPAPQDGLESVVLVQSPKGGRIASALWLPTPK